MRLLCIPILLAATCAAAQAPEPRDKPRVEKRIERISHEDAGSRIDELRVGGESQAIVVQPKAGVPGYEMQPTDGARSRTMDRDIRGGPKSQRVWNVFSF